jgi:hypothetical protein
LEHGQARGQDLVAAIGLSFDPNAGRAGGRDIGGSLAEEYDGVQLSGIGPLVSLEANWIGGLQGRQQPWSPAEGARRSDPHTRRLARGSVGVLGS